jgi:large subunit ribosomal protein L13
MEKKTYTIDAEGRPLGRLASEVAQMLRGKGTPQFERHIAPNIAVTVINASKVKLTGNKLAAKYYKHYTGHPGGMRKTKVEAVIAKKGYGEIIEHAVQGMIPGNKLRPILMKHLTIND